MGSLPNGILEGVYSDFGNYDECLDTSSPESSEESLIEGQYCILKAILPFPKVNSYRKEVFDYEIVKSAKNFLKDFEKHATIRKNDNRSQFSQWNSLSFSPLHAIDL